MTNQSKVAREALNRICIDGHLNATLDYVMASNSPDGTFNVLGVLAAKAIEIALELAAQAEPDAGAGGEMPPEDECIVHIYPSDLERMAKNETTATVFSVAVGCPEEKSVPLYTAEQVRAALSRQAQTAEQPSQPEASKEGGADSVWDAAARFSKLTNGGWFFDDGHRLLAFVSALASQPVAQQPTQGERPIDMVLFCPNCGMQHIDAPEPRYADNGEDNTTWNNPPHRSHLCAGCGHIWRPADVPTNGVAAVKTAGKADLPILSRAQSAAPEASKEHEAIAGLSAEMDAFLARWRTCSIEEMRYFAMKLRIIAAAPQPVDAQVGEPGGARAEVERLTALINTPELHDFAKGTVLEAVHQRERWGTDHDAGKTVWDWFWLIGYLAQKAADAFQRGDSEKALHHTITTAAACANWHAAMLGQTNMRPGIAPPADDAAHPQAAQGGDK